MPMVIQGAWPRRVLRSPRPRGAKFACHGLDVTRHERVLTGVVMADPREEGIRATLGGRIAKIIKAQGYTARPLQQGPRATPGRAEATHRGPHGTLSPSPPRPLAT